MGHLWDMCICIYRLDLYYTHSHTTQTHRDDDESNEAASLRKKRVAMEEKLARLAQATIDRELVCVSMCMNGVRVS
jgi:hypothetical protein